MDNDDISPTVSKQHILELLSQGGLRMHSNTTLVNSSLDIGATLSSVQSKIEELHGQEMSIFNEMRSQINNELKQHSQDVVRKMDDQKEVISSLIKENGHMRSIQEKLVHKVKELKGTLVTRSMYDSCISEKEELNKLFDHVQPLMAELKETFTKFKKSGMAVLINSRSDSFVRLQEESVKRKAVEKELAEQKNTADVLSANVKKFLGDFEKLLQSYFGVKVNLKEVLENKNSNFAQLSNGLSTVHGKVKQLSETFARRIEAEETKVLSLVLSPD